MVIVTHESYDSVLVGTETLNGSRETYGGISVVVLETGNVASLRPDGSDGGTLGRRRTSTRAAPRSKNDGRLKQCAVSVSPPGGVSRRRRRRRWVLLACSRRHADTLRDFVTAGRRWTFPRPFKLPVQQQLMKIFISSYNGI